LWSLISQADDLVTGWKEFRDDVIKRNIEDIERMIEGSRGIDREAVYLKMTELKFRFVNYMMPIERLQRNLEILEITNKGEKPKNFVETSQKFENLYHVTKGIVEFLKKETEMLNIRTFKKNSHFLFFISLLKN
jgi:hypothetical protein